MYTNKIIYRQWMQVTKLECVDDILTSVVSSCGHRPHPSATAQTCLAQHVDSLHQASHQSSADAKHTTTIKY